MASHTSNQRLHDWVSHWASIFKPSAIYWCDGSREEYDRICQELVDAGTFKRLDEDKRPNCVSRAVRPCRRGPCRRSHLHRHRPTRTTPVPPTTGAIPTNCAKRCSRLYDGCMQGRTLYVVPFSMGPIGSPIAHIGVQLSDSPYVAVSMRTMTRMGQAVLDVLGDGDWVPCLHSVGMPLVDGAPMCPGRATPTTSTSRISPRRVRSGPTARATAATPCWARSASPCASHRRWRATAAGWPSTCSSSASRRPSGEKKYVAAAFPSACGKTNMAMMIPTMPGWKIETIGDDIAWMKFGDDGRLYAINPEAGFFGVAPGTSDKTNRNAMETLWGNAIFTNVAETPDGDVWWEEHDRRPSRRASPTGKAMTWTPESRPRPRRTPTRASPCRRRSARRSRPSGKTPAACRSRRSSSAAAEPPTCRW